jgi:hypothetical protein
MKQDLAQFFGQVHLLAMAYHWSERDILDLSRKKRRLYVSMVQREQAK